MGSRRESAKVNDKKSREVKGLSARSGTRSGCICGFGKHVLILKARTAPRAMLDAVIVTEGLGKGWGRGAEEAGKF